MIGAGEFLDRLARHPRTAPALVEPGRMLCFGELRVAVDELADRFRDDRIRVVATRLDNGIDAAVCDLAALRAGVAHVPLPPFFTEAQVRHAVAVGQAEVVIDAAGTWHRTGVASTLADGIAKITFTSGTTGTPKGVCLAATGMLAVADGVVEATRDLPIAHHLAALPLAVLLENLAGLYAPLLRGAAVMLWPMAKLGIQGASAMAPGTFDAAIRRSGAGSVVLLPQMLRGWTAWLEATGRTAPATLAIAAVGGAVVGAGVLERARAVGIPAFEGYGLSEGASVQTLNVPGADRPGTVGRALPHARVRIADDGEIEIGGTVMLGYLGRDGFERFQGDWLRTGDLGSIDDDGFVRIHGRRKDVLITSFGRNVGPEWVEAELHGASQAIARAVVIGDGEPRLGAVVWPASEAVDDATIDHAVAEANRRLPDYARVGGWVRARRPFDAAGGLATDNGRPRRAAIAAAYHQALFSLQESRP